MKKREKKSRSNTEINFMLSLCFILLIMVGFVVLYSHLQSKINIPFYEYFYILFFFVFLIIILFFFTFKK